MQIGKFKNWEIGKLEIGKFLEGNQILRGEVIFQFSNFPIS
jgi:hypothetical protein